MDANLYTVLSQRFPEPSSTVLTTPDGRDFSYADLEHESACYAQVLHKLGLKPGDRVSVQVEKTPANLWLYLGVLRAGLVYHPLNTAYAPDEMRFFLSNAETRLLVCDPAKLTVYEPLCDEVGVAKIETLDAQGEGTLSALAAAQSGEFQTISRAPDDMAALLYSSGTTGRPKGIVLSHDNLRANATVLVDLWGFSRSDVLLHALPIYHVHGLFVAVHCALMSGSRLLWLPRFEVDQVLAQLPRATVMMGVPTYYTRLLAEPDFERELLAGMRLFISGSAPLLTETFDAFVDRTGHAILERYGMSETGMNTSNPLLGERVAGTVGLPLPGTEVRVCDSEHRELPLGDIGEVEVRGANVFSGYWRMPEKTAEDFTQDGWFVTGDQGRFDEHGYLSIVGRSKDMVISGGLNVYPKEVESVLNDYPEILESAVIGVPDADLGEAVVAWVVPEKGALVDEASLRQRLREKIAGFKVPKAIRAVDELPRNAMGKVQKTLLRERW